MGGSEEFVRFMAAWALVHETADEGWKAAVERGRSAEPGSLDAGPEAFVDGLSALIAEEKDRLKARLASGDDDGQAGGNTREQLEELRFEVAELRGMLESMQASLDALARDPER